MQITHRLLAAFLIAGCGASVMFAMQSFRTNDLALIPVAGLGAGLAGAGMAALFGQPGRGGMGAAVLGAVGSTFVGAALAGLAVGVSSRDVALMLLAPPFVVTSILVSPPVLLVWTGWMTLAHLVMRHVRQDARQPD